ncbi:MAG: peptidyl-prolyl cis-trans isomerase [Lentisphaeria bacterium]|nr:peptidyl-prolyl cis-trans isomerase [Lentisphaeria bacterium]
MGKFVKINNFVLPILSGAIFILSGCKPKDAGDGNSKMTDVVGQEEVVEAKVSPVTGMRELPATSLAFCLDKLSVTWGELQDYFKLNGIFAKAALGPEVPGEFLLNGLDEVQQKKAKKSLKVLLRSQILLKKAKEDMGEVTDEERKAFGERWELTHKDRSFAEYLSQFPEKTKHRLQLNRGEMYLLLKYTDKLLENVEVPAGILAEQKQKARQMHSAFAIQEAQRKKDFEQLARRPEINTDEGFAALAKEFSEGVDADKGGVLDELLTRNELSEMNFDQPFTTQLGETSPLIETPTGFRFIRVLEVVAPEQKGGEERLKIAQIFLPKYELDGVPTEDEVEIMVTNYFKEKALSEKLEEFLEQSHFECPLFPELRQEWPTKKKLPENGADEGGTAASANPS